MQPLSNDDLSLNVLYVEGSLNRALAFRQAFDELITFTIAATRQEALLALSKGHTIELVIFNDLLDGSLFLQAVQPMPHLRGLPVILLSDQPAVMFTAHFRGHVIDVFPIDYAPAALRSRLSYLIQKKRYAETKQETTKSFSVRIPVGKRLFDMVVSFTALLLLSPLLTIVSILIRLDSKGPILYRSKRVGTGYRVFDMYKFRTMRTGADKMLSSMASKNMYNTAPAEEPADTLCEVCQLAGMGCQRLLYLDSGQQICEDVYQRNLRAKAMFMKFKEDPRVTKLGRFLRNTSIDELPQLLNILRGDMSFVGNRPLPPYEAEKLTTTGYARRFAAPAGLTGLWQVTKRGKASVSDLERIYLDVLYAKKYSLRTDLYIMLRTVVAIWQKENV